MRGRILCTSVILSLASLLFLGEVSVAQGPDSTAAYTAPEISLEAKLDRTSVPANRTVTLTVELRWHGDLDRYEVAEIEQPVVRNLEIVGSGSSNRVETGPDGLPVSVKSYTYSLKPKELGMAYVEGLTVLYTDTQTGKSHRLMTQRLELEVVDPVPEGRRPSNWFVFAVGAVALALAGLVFYFRRSRGGVPEPTVQREPTLEERLLEQLRTEVNTSSPTFDVKEGYTRLSRIARRFLVERFGLSGPELTTDELLDELQRNTADERLLKQAEEILRRCDAVKFGGEPGDRGEIARFVGVVEFWLTRPSA